MTTINIYLSFAGNCREAFEHYRTVFGGEFAALNTFGEMPPQEGMPPIPDSEKDLIMHVSLPISEETVLMGSDTSAALGQTFSAGNNFAISIATNERELADQYFTKLTEGGTINMPLQETFWGSYYGNLIDRFGINWMINCDLQQLS